MTGHLLHINLRVILMETGIIFPMKWICLRPMLTKVFIKVCLAL